MATFLADKSALTRSDTRPEVRGVIEPLLLAGRIATCGIVDLELLYSAPSPAIYQDLAEVLRAMPRVPITDVVVDRALEVQALLAGRSQHRSVSLPDLLVAACAEVAGLTVLHYDTDYERIATLTGQPTQWVVPRGSVA
jgi:predicted nucleic acid-binding protein